jgi:MoaA/NifB/PqqE/SkfB family radical SAM enzyme
LNHQRNDNRGYYGVASRLLCNALKFRYSQLRSRPQKPAVLSLALTNRCNSHCIMCNIWKTADNIPELKSLEISAREITDLVSQPLFSNLVEIDLTGGEPHLRDDLVDIVLGISQLKKSSLRKLRSIIITSNGFLTKRIISNYTDILSSLKGTDTDLVAVISLDGIGETHDKIRGTQGAFKLVSETIGALLDLKQKYENLILGIKTTVLPDNIDALDSILDFAISKDIFHIISPVLFTEARFKNLNRKDDLSLGPNEYKKVLDFYSRDELATSYFYSTTSGFLSNHHRCWVCTALFNYLFVDYDGKIYPCEIIPEPVGDLNMQNIRDIWESPRARIFRSRIGNLEYCRACHEPGAVRYSAVTEGMSYLKFLNKLGGRKFRESWRGEGFSKYT